MRTTKPTATNTGAGIIRPYPTKVINGDVTLSVAGQRLDDTIVHGRVFIKAANVVVSNCVVDGGRCSHRRRSCRLFSGRSHRRVFSFGRLDYAQRTHGWIRKGNEPYPGLDRGCSACRRAFTLQSRLL